MGELPHFQTVVRSPDLPLTAASTLGKRTPDPALASYLARERSVSRTETLGLAHKSRYTSRIRSKFIP